MNRECLYENRIYTNKQIGLLFIKIFLLKIKPNICRYCSKLLSLTHHVKIHENTGERPYNWDFRVKLLRKMSHLK